MSDYKHQSVQIENIEQIAYHSGLLDSVSFNPYTETPFKDRYKNMPNLKFVDTSNTILDNQWGKVPYDSGYWYIKENTEDKVLVPFTDKISCPTPHRPLNGIMSSGIASNQDNGAMWGDYRYTSGNVYLKYDTTEKKIKLSRNNTEWSTLDGTVSGIVFLDLAGGGGGGGGAHHDTIPIIGTTRDLYGGNGGGGGAAATVALDLKRTGLVQIKIGGGGSAGTSDPGSSNVYGYWGGKGVETSVYIQGTKLLQCDGGEGAPYRSSTGGVGPSGGRCTITSAMNTLSNGVLEIKTFDGGNGGLGGITINNNSDTNFSAKLAKSYTSDGKISNFGIFPDILVYKSGEYNLGVCKDQFTTTGRSIDCYGGNGGYSIFNAGKGGAGAACGKDNTHYNYTTQSATKGSDGICVIHCIWHDE